MMLKSSAQHPSIVLLTLIVISLLLITVKGTLGSTKYDQNGCLNYNYEFFSGFQQPPFLQYSSTNTFSTTQSCSHQNTLKINPIMNKLTNTLDGYQCECKLGYTGSKCEFKLDIDPSIVFPIYNPGVQPTTNLPAGVPIDLVIHDAPSYRYRLRWAVTEDLVALGSGLSSFHDELNVEKNNIEHNFKGKMTVQDSSVAQYRIISTLPLESRTTDTSINTDTVKDLIHMGSSTNGDIAYIPPVHMLSNFDPSLSPFTSYVTISTPTPAQLTSDVVCLTLLAYEISDDEINQHANGNNNDNNNNPQYQPIAQFTLNRYHLDANPIQSLPSCSSPREMTNFRGYQMCSCIDYLNHFGELCQYKFKWENDTIANTFQKRVQMQMSIDPWISSEFDVLLPASTDTKGVNTNMNVNSDSNMKTTAGSESPDTLFSSTDRNVYKFSPTDLLQFSITIDPNTPSHIVDDPLAWVMLYSSHTNDYTPLILTSQTPEKITFSFIVKDLFGQFSYLSRVSDYYGKSAEIYATIFNPDGSSDFYPFPTEIHAISRCELNNLSNQCTSYGTADCQPVTGECICRDGFMGEHCEIQLFIQPTYDNPENGFLLESSEVIYGSQLLLIMRNLLDGFITPPQYPVPPLGFYETGQSMDQQSSSSSSFTPLNPTVTLSIWYSNRMSGEPSTVINVPKDTTEDLWMIKIPAMPSGGLTQNFNHVATLTLTLSPTIKKTIFFRITSGCNRSSLRPPAASSSRITGCGYHSGLGIVWNCQEGWYGPECTEHRSSLTLSNTLYTHPSGLFLYNGATVNWNNLGGGIGVKNWSFNFKLVRFVDQREFVDETTRIGWRLQDSYSPTTFNSNPTSTSSFKFDMPDLNSNYWDYSDREAKHKWWVMVMINSGEGSGVFQSLGFYDFFSCSNQAQQLSLLTPSSLLYPSCYTPNTKQCEFLPLIDSTLSLSDLCQCKDEHDGTLYQSFTGPQCQTTVRYKVYPDIGVFNVFLNTADGYKGPDGFGYSERSSYSSSNILNGGSSGDYFWFNGDETGQVTYRLQKFSWNNNLNTFGVSFGYENIHSYRYYPVIEETTITDNNDIAIFWAAFDFITIHFSTNNPSSLPLILSRSTATEHNDNIPAVGYCASGDKVIEDSGDVKCNCHDDIFFGPFCQFYINVRHSDYFTWSVPDPLHPLHNNDPSTLTEPSSDPDYYNIRTGAKVKVRLASLLPRDDRTSIGHNYYLSIALSSKNDGYIIPQLYSLLSFDDAIEWTVPDIHQDNYNYEIRFQIYRDVSLLTTTTHQTTLDGDSNQDFLLYQESFSLDNTYGQAREKWSSYECPIGHETNPNALTPEEACLDQCDENFYTLIPTIPPSTPETCNTLLLFKRLPAITVPAMVEPLIVGEVAAFSCDAPTMSGTLGRVTFEFRSSPGYSTPVSVDYVILTEGPICGFTVPPQTTVTVGLNDWSQTVDIVYYDDNDAVVWRKDGQQYHIFSTSALLYNFLSSAPYNAFQDHLPCPFGSDNAGGLEDVVFKSNLSDFDCPCKDQWFGKSCESHVSYTEQATEYGSIITITAMISPDFLTIWPTRSHPSIWFFYSAGGNGKRIQWSLFPELTFTPMKPYTFEYTVDGSYSTDTYIYADYKPTWNDPMSSYASFDHTKIIAMISSTSNQYAAMCPTAPSYCDVIGTQSCKLHISSNTQYCFCKENYYGVTCQYNRQYRMVVDTTSFNSNVVGGLSTTPNGIYPGAQITLDIPDTDTFMDGLMIYYKSTALSTLPLTPSATPISLTLPQSLGENISERFWDLGDGFWPTNVVLTYSTTQLSTQTPSPISPRPFTFSQEVNYPLMSQCEWWDNNYIGTSTDGFTQPCILVNTKSCDLITNIPESVCTCLTFAHDILNPIKPGYVSQTFGLQCQHTISIPLGPYYLGQGVKILVGTYDVVAPDLTKVELFSTITNQYLTLPLTPMNPLTTDLLDDQKSFWLTIPHEMVDIDNSFGVENIHSVMTKWNKNNEVSLANWNKFSFRITPQSSSPFTTEKFQIIEPCFWSSFTSNWLTCAQNEHPTIPNTFLAVESCLNPTTKEIECTCKPSYNGPECRMKVEITPVTTNNFYASTSSPTIPQNNDPSVFLFQPIKATTSWLRENDDSLSLGVSSAYSFEINFGSYSYKRDTNDFTLTNPSSMDKRDVYIGGGSSDMVRNGVMFSDLFGENTQWYEELHQPQYISSTFTSSPISNRMNRITGSRHFSSPLSYQWSNNEIINGKSNTAYGLGGRADYRSGGGGGGELSPGKFTHQSNSDPVLIKPLHFQADLPQGIKSTFGLTCPGGLVTGYGCLCGQDGIFGPDCSYKIDITTGPRLVHNLYYWYDQEYTFTLTKIQPVAISSLGLKWPIPDNFHFQLSQTASSDRGLVSERVKLSTTITSSTYSSSGPDMIIIQAKGTFRTPKYDRNFADYSGHLYLVSDTSQPPINHPIQPFRTLTQSLGGSICTPKYTNGMSTVPIQYQYNFDRRIFHQCQCKDGYWGEYCDSPAPLQAPGLAIPYDPAWINNDKMMIDLVITFSDVQMPWFGSSSIQLSAVYFIAVPTQLSQTPQYLHEFTLLSNPHQLSYNGELHDFNQGGATSTQYQVVFVYWDQYQDIRPFVITEGYNMSDDMAFTVSNDQSNVQRNSTQSIHKHKTIRKRLSLSSLSPSSSSSSTMPISLQSSKSIETLATTLIPKEGPGPWWNGYTNLNYGHLFTVTVQCTINPLTCQIPFKMTTGTDMIVNNNFKPVTDLTRHITTSSTTPPLMISHAGVQITITIPSFVGVKPSAKLQLLSFVNNGSGTNTGNGDATDLYSVVISSRMFNPTRDNTFHLTIPSTLIASKLLYSITLTNLAATPPSTTPATQTIYTPVFETMPQCYQAPKDFGDYNKKDKWVTKCQNNGQCSRTTQQCSCTQAFSGSKCETELPLTEQPCGQCPSSNIDRCDLETNQCVCTSQWLSNTCTSPASCLEKSKKRCNADNGYITPSTNDPTKCGDTCQCNNYWSGLSCQTCTLQCQNGGEAYSKCNKCGCTMGFTGQFCQCKSVQGTITINGYNDAVLMYYNALVKEIIDEATPTKMAIQSSPFDTTQTSISTTTNPNLIDLMIASHTINVQVTRIMGELLNLDQPTIQLTLEPKADPSPAPTTPSTSGRPYLDHTLISITITYSCEGSNPLLTREDLDKAWSKMISQLRTNEEIKTIFIFPDDENIDINDNGLVETIPTLPTGTDRLPVLAVPPKDNTNLIIILVCSIVGGLLLIGAIIFVLRKYVFTSSSKALSQQGNAASVELTVS